MLSIPCMLAAPGTEPSAGLPSPQWCWGRCQGSAGGWQGAGRGEEEEGARPRLCVQVLNLSVPAFWGRWHGRDQGGGSREGWHKGVGRWAWNREGDASWDGWKPTGAESPGGLGGGWHLSGGAARWGPRGAETTRVSGNPEPKIARTWETTGGRVCSRARFCLHHKLLLWSGARVLPAAVGMGASCPGGSRTRPHCPPFTRHVRWQWQ